MNLKTTMPRVPGMYPDAISTPTNGAQDDNVGAAQTHDAISFSVNDTKDDVVAAAGW
jgi:hypothetical protein